MKTIFVILAMVVLSGCSADPNRLAYAEQAATQYGEQYQRTQMQVAPYDQQQSIGLTSPNGLQAQQQLDRQMARQHTDLQLQMLVGQMQLQNYRAY